MILSKDTRSTSQELWDTMAVLGLCDAVANLGSPVDNLKAQKLAFLFELDGQRQQLMVGHYKFFRYTYGPYSKILARDIERLEDLGFLTKTSRRPTSRARFLLEYVDTEIQSSKPARTAWGLLQSVAREYGRIQSSQLVNKVYAMKVPVYEFRGELMKVRDIPSFLDILDPLHSNLPDLLPFSKDAIEVFEQEMALPVETLDPESRSYKATVRTALERMGQGLQL